MSTEAHTFKFAQYPDDVVVAYDPDTNMLTILTEQKLVGAVYLGAVEPVPEPEVVRTEPIVDPVDEDEADE